MSQTNTFDFQKILGVGRYAPSSHNTQPWTVKVDLNKSSLIVGFNSERQLKVGDPDKRELFISLGCFIETLILAAGDIGYSVNYTFLGIESQKVARLEFFKTDLPDKRSDWEKLIRDRRTDRRYYDRTILNTEDVAEIISMRYKHAHIEVTNKKTEIEFLAKMTHEATYGIMSDPLFRNELSGWVRHNWTNEPDGMPAYTQGIPGPVSLLAKKIIKTKKVAGDQAKKDAKRVSRSAGLGLICVDSESQESWLDAGRLYQRICLTALAKDIKTSAVSAAVILPSTAHMITESLKLKGSPVALVRFGYKRKTVKASPRLSIESFSDLV